MSLCKNTVCKQLAVVVGVYKILHLIVSIIEITKRPFVDQVLNPSSKRKSKKWSVRLIQSARSEE